MKNIKIVLTGFFILSVSVCHMAQTVNWNALEQSNHFVALGVGWDYGLTYSVAYGYQLNSAIPLMLNGQVSIPSGELLLDDYKLKAGAQVVLLNQSHWKGALSLQGIYRRYGNPLVRLQNFGSEMKGTLGYYHDKWFFAGELGFDKAIVAHFEHSDIYKENILQTVQDGWYEPATGGHFLYGVQTGWSFRRSDISLSIGKVVTQDFKSTPLIPYYLSLAFSYRIGA
ncbi:MAG TPA: hypothetical protein PKA00_18230 [Saprospiraceae bacterium]|nr:hypothetical protein [Saprospiraceae bacterium]HMQ84857.1 hypothetical protein [Saprospiraceae bacterium]